VHILSLFVFVKETKRKLLAHLRKKFKTSSPIAEA